MSAAPPILGSGPVWVPGAGPRGRWSRDCRVCSTQGPNRASGLLVTLGDPCGGSVARGGLRNSPADPGCPAYANPGSALEPVQSAGQHDLRGPHLLLQLVALAFQGGSWLLSGNPVWLDSDQMHTLNQMVILLPNLLFF